MLDRIRKPDATTVVSSATWRWIALLCYCAILGCLLSRHVFWRDEVQAYQIAAYNDSISSLFQSLRYEGHPGLWYLLLRALSALFHSPNVMLGAHWLLASLNAFLILWFCPIPQTQRIFCCFGYFMLFEYGVICRNYAMGALLAFLFVVVHRRYKRAAVGPALILALLVHTSIPGAFLAVSLLAFFILEHCASRRRQLVAIVIVGASAAAMILYLNPPADSLFATVYREARHQLTVKTAIHNARMFLYVAAPIPPRHRLDFWNRNWTDSIAPDYVRMAIQYTATTLCLSLAAISMIHRRNVALLFVVGTLLVAGFSIMNGQTALRHQGQWFILLLLCYWVDGTSGDAETRIFGGWQRKIRQVFPAVIFAIQPLAAILPIKHSFNYPFSPTPPMVKQVLNERFDHQLLSAFPEAFVAGVSAASGEAVYSPEQDRFERFSLWTDNLLDQVTAQRLAATYEIPVRRLEALVDNHHSLILFTHKEEARKIVSRLSKDITVRQLVFQQGAILADEANVALLLQKAE